MKTRLAAMLLFTALTLSRAFANPAVFDWVSYRGHDPVEAAKPLRAGSYRNPVIPGFQPDPSIVRVGRDYYLVNSSFAFFPGLPIFHSRDLVNWTQIGNAIDRPGMVDFSGLGIARAIFAPTIRFRAGSLYIVNTCIECGSNFIISATDPKGPWSAPVFLNAIDGIDPDLFFDDDGRAWIANNGPPPETPKYNGHRAIWIQEFDWKATKMIGPRQVLIDGGVEPATKPIWTEGPHIFKRDGWYYLITAEGGTAGGHSETVYRSRAVTGPYVPGPVNPILTQRDLDPHRPFPVYATGHADFVQTPGGQWWSVFLGTRPYEANLSNLGRETFLLPVHWPKGGWPSILPPKTPVPQIVARPPLRKGVAARTSAWRDEFTAATLAPEWLTLRTPASRWFTLAQGALALEPRSETLSGLGNPSFLARRQRHSFAAIETALRYRPEHEGDRAGLAAFADERHHYFVGLTGTASGTAIIVSMRNGAGDPDFGRVLATARVTLKPDEPIHLRITARGAAYDFAYRITGGKWQNVLTNADGRVLASELTNQFTGTVIGPYAALGPR